MAELQREVAALWQTDELRRQKPTPLDGGWGARGAGPGGRRVCGWIWVHRGQAGIRSWRRHECARVQVQGLSITHCCAVWSSRLAAAAVAGYG